MQAAYVTGMIRERAGRQTWQSGDVVKVGFVTLRMVSARAVVDGMPDIYTLESLDGSRRYEFVPHNGLRRVGSYLRGRV
jgi:hypothetical protein